MRALAIDSRMARLGFDLRGIPGLEAAWLSRFPYGLGRMDLPADGTAMGTWTDLSGKGRDLTQATSANQPVWRRAGVNLLRAAYASPTSAGCYADSSTLADDDGWLKIVSSGPSNPSAIIGGAPNAAQLRDIPLGRQITVSGRIRLDAAQTSPISPTRARRLELTYYDSGAWVVNQSTQAPNTVGQSVVFLTVTVPSTATGAFIRLNNYGESGAVVYWKDIQLELGPTATPWLPPGNAQGMQFDGVDDFLQTVSLAGWPETTVYAVATVLGRSGSWRSIVAHRRLSPNYDGFMLAANTADGWNVTFNDGSAARQMNSSSNIVNTEPHILTAKVGPSANISRAYLDGVQFQQNSVNTYNPVATTPQPLYMGGADNGLVNPFSGLIHDVIICSQAHDETTRQRVEAWLARKNSVTLT